MASNRNFWLIIFVISTILLITGCNRKSSPDSETSKASQTIRLADKLLASKPQAANKLLDSCLKEQIVNGLPDSVLSSYYEIKGDVILAMNLKDSAYQFMQDRYSAISSEKFPLSKAHIGLWLISHYSEDGRYLIARKYLDEVIQISDRYSLAFEKARATNLQGVVKTSQGDYVGAQKDLLNAAELFDSISDSHALSPVYLNIASNYLAINESQLALQYYRKAADLALQYHDSLNYQKTLNNLGILYKLRRPDSAEYYFRKSWGFTPSAPWSVQSLTARFNLAGLYYDKKEYIRSLELYQEVLDLSRKYNVKSGEYRAMSGLGNVYEAMNRDNEAAETFKKGAELAGEAGETPVQIGLLSGLVYMYEKMGQMNKAYSVSKIQRHLSDSLLAIDKQIAVRNLEILYNTEKTERLNESNKSKLLLLQSKVRMHRNILIIVIAFFIALGFLLYRMYNLYRQRDVAYQTLFRKYKAEIELVGVKQVLENEQTLPFTNKRDSIDPTYLKLIDFFEKEKPYLNPDLKFDQVALNLKISRKQLQHVIQDQTGLNFNGFVNQFRIQEAMLLLADPNRKNYKIEAIAKESGFGSKANFYSVFTLVTGSKPSEFR